MNGITSAGMINFLIKNIKSIKFPLLNVEGEIGFHTINKLYLDKYNRLYVNYTTVGNFCISSSVAELNNFFMSNIYKKVLNQTQEEVWND